MYVLSSEFVTQLHQYKTEGVIGEEVVRYFTSEEEANRALSRDQSNVQRALIAIGSWSDLDFDDMLDELDRIRHRSKPTPPIDLDV